MYILLLNDKCIYYYFYFQRASVCTLLPNNIPNPLEEIVDEGEGPCDAIYGDEFSQCRPDDGRIDVDM